MISMLVPAALGSAGLLLCAPTSGVGRLTTPRHRWVARLGELVHNHPYQLAIGGVVVGAATVGQHFPTLVAAVFAGGTAMMMLRRLRARRQAARQRGPRQPQGGSDRGPRCHSGVAIEQLGQRRHLLLGRENDRGLVIR